MKMLDDQTCSISLDSVEILQLLRYVLRFIQFLENSDSRRRFLKLIYQTSFKIAQWQVNSDSLEFSRSSTQIMIKDTDWAGLSPASLCLSHVNSDSLLIIRLICICRHLLTLFESLCGKAWKTDHAPAHNGKREGDTSLCDSESCQPYDINIINIVINNTYYLHIININIRHWQSLRDVQAERRHCV